MASLVITNAWLDPSASLTADQIYIIQNKTTSPIQFFEGTAFDAATNANDGVIIVPLSDGGSGPNSIRWEFDSAHQIRVRMVNAGYGGANYIEFALAT